VGSDIETAMGCLNEQDGIKVIVIGGTGSNCFGTDGKSMIKIGGFGHVLGTNKNIQLQFTIIFENR
jgi:N-acetylglucosamine kinase-like BadF-type ATPase